MPARKTITVKPQHPVATSNGDIRQQLLAERREVIVEIAAQATNGNGSSPSAHDTDYPAMSQLRDIEFSRREALQRRLHFVDEALERIGAGSYGTCRECGRKIAEKRLAADPAVSLCVECQAASETSVASSSL
jgi:DnaK suppressor protein